MSLKSLGIQKPTTITTKKLNEHILHVFLVHFNLYNFVLSCLVYLLSLSIYIYIVNKIKHSILIIKN